MSEPRAYGRRPESVCRAIVAAIMAHPEVLAMTPHRLDVSVWFDKRTGEPADVEVSPTFKRDVRDPEEGR
jgi:hypothetical protein